MRRGSVGFWLRFAVVVLKPVLTVCTRRQWLGQRNIPRAGPVILAVNHISYVDPLVLAHFVWDAGRAPRFMAKESVFRARFVGRVVRGARQIPVHRYTETAGEALSAAVAALERGECVIIYPEGTVTKDPAYWPMRARTGVARLALITGVPVVPIGQWGAQHIFGRDKRLRLLPPHRVRLLAGAPVDLGPYIGREPNARVLRDATDAVMTRVRDLVGALRDEPPPTEVYDPRLLLPVDDGDARRSA